MTSKYDKRRILNYALKRRIPVLYYQQNRSIQEILDITGYKSTTTIYDALRLFDETGDAVNPYASQGGRPRKLSLDDVLFLEFLLRDNPALYLDELQKELEQTRDTYVSRSTIQRALQRRGWRHKKLSKKRRSEMSF